MQRRALSEGSEEFPSDEAALFARYGSIIFAYIRKHVSSREDAEDLTLEVFMAAIEKRSCPPCRQRNNLPGSNESRTISWLMCIARPGRSGR